MSHSILEKFVREYIEAQPTDNVLFIWHGGEPLILPISFYENALELQQKYANGKRIENAIQTNATLITDDWCRFLKSNRFLVGVSIDGTREMHNHYRTTADGRPSFDSVCRGIDLLNKHSVEWNVLATVNRFNADKAKEFYRFFRNIGCRFLQFTPVVERTDNCKDSHRLVSGNQPNGILTDYSITPQQWGEFLCEVFDEWIQRDVGDIFVQIFDATLANWMGEQPGLCMLSAHCGHAAAMEADGTLYSCDHFVFPQNRIGNIHNDSLKSIIHSEQQRQFSLSKVDKLPRRCHECKFLFACYGECPKNRFLYDKFDPYPHNYLCDGYLRFFAHTAPYFDAMKSAILSGNSPSSLMREMKSN